LRALGARRGSGDSLAGRFLAYELPVGRCGVTARLARCARGRVERQFAAVYASEQTPCSRSAILQLVATVHGSVGSSVCSDLARHRKGVDHGLSCADACQASSQPTTGKPIKGKVPSMLYTIAVVLLVLWLLGLVTSYTMGGFIHVLVVIAVVMVLVNLISGRRSL
jgi:hypothetical protein